MLFAESPEEHINTNSFDDEYFVYRDDSGFQKYSNEYKLEEEYDSVNLETAVKILSR